MNLNLVVLHVLKGKGQFHENGKCMQKQRALAVSGGKGSVTVMCEPNKPNLGNEGDSRVR